MMDMQEWIEARKREHRRLYKRYGQPLESEHFGEYVAISLDGQTILGTQLGELLGEALENFGRDNFAIAKVGHDTVETLRQIA